MQLQSPLRSVTPTLDGDILFVLAGADDWFTVPQLAARISGRSDEGIRRTIARLVSEGVVATQQAGRATLYRLNREHLAASAILQLAQLSLEFRRRLSEEFAAWPVPPVYAALFGSAARGDMGADSDIDIFVVRPEDAGAGWDDAVSALVSSVHRWTGNDPRVLEFADADVSPMEPVIRSVLEEGVPVHGDRAYLRRLGKR